LRRNAQVKLRRMTAGTISVLFQILAPTMVALVFAIVLCALAAGAGYMGWVYSQNGD
jgi:Flp pilus assembly protein TadG